MPAPAPQEVPLRRRPAPGLGPEWAITGDDGEDVTLWREDRRAGTAGRIPFSSRWQARRASGGPVTTLAARDGRYPSRARALAALAAEAEHARRRATAARQVPLATAPGWQLTQTLADADQGAWQVTGPGGIRAGTVRRSWPGARTWMGHPGRSRRQAIPTPGTAHSRPCTPAPMTPRRTATGAPGTPPPAPSPPATRASKNSRQPPPRPGPQALAAGGQQTR